MAAMEDDLLSDSGYATHGITARTTQNMFVFGRYQTGHNIYGPIREWMTSDGWNQFTAQYCQRYPNWGDLSNDERRTLGNSSPYRVLMLRVAFNPDGSLLYNCIRTADGEPIYDDTTLRTCPVDPTTGCAVGLPLNIRNLLIANALSNLVFAGNTEKRTVMIDLYPNRPPGAIHGFHTDSGTENAVRDNASENLEYVSLLFLPPENAVTRGTVLSTGPLNGVGNRATASLLCRAGTTIMFRDQAYLHAPSVIHATPRPLPTGYEDSVQNHLTFQFRTPMREQLGEQRAEDFNPDLPRLFVRVHTSLHPRILKTDVPIPTIDYRRPVINERNPIDADNVNDDAAIIAALQGFNEHGYTAGSKTKNGTHKLKDISFFCKRKNYASFCKSLTGSSISFAIDKSSHKSIHKSNTMKSNTIHKKSIYKKSPKTKKLKTHSINL